MTTSGNVGSIKRSAPPTSTSMPWSGIPDDLLQDVYVKVVGLLHRVRFAAVCRSWRAAAVGARQVAPPTLPWLICSSSSDSDSKMRRMYCPEDDHVIRIALPSKLVGNKIVGAHDGGWVAALGQDMQLSIVNLFSAIEVRLPNRETRKVYSDQSRCISSIDNIRKVVFSESPTSSGCIIAAITGLCDALVIGCPQSGLTTKIFNGVGLVDLLFFNKQFYGLDMDGELVKFKICVSKEDGKVVIGEPSRLPIRMHSLPFMGPNDIVELDGKLAMVVTYWPSHGAGREPFVRVYRLVDESMTEYAHRWEEVTNLGDYALFLGAMWSKAVYVPVAGHGEMQRSCIYADDVTYLTSLDGHGDRVYPMEDKSRDDTMQGIKTAGSYLDTDDPCGMWILPPDF